MPLAKMSFRERDEARYVGVRPGHKGEQVAEDDFANNGVTVIYTVPLGYVFYLTDWSLSMVAGATNQNAVLFIRDASDVLAWNIHRLRSAENTQMSESNAFFFPQEIPNNYDVCVSSDAAGCIAYGHVHGWKEGV